MPSFSFIIGGNRGIGLALVKELLHRSADSQVFASTRDPSNSPELDEVVANANGRVIVVKLDMTNEDSVKAALSDVQKTTSSLDGLIINAGVMLGVGPIFDLQAADLLENLNGNIVGPHNVLKYFSPLVLASKSKKRYIAVTSSLTGSISTLPVWGGYSKQMGFEHISIAGYAATKSGTNGLIRQWAFFLEPLGVPVAAVHPGIVQTRMGKDVPDAITTEESAQGYVNVLERLDVSQTSQGMLSYDGSTIPW